MRLSEAQQDRYRRQESHALFPEYYLIKVNQFDDVARDSLDQWIYFLKLDLIADDQLLAEQTGLRVGDVRGLREELWNEYQGSRFSE